MIKNVRKNNRKNESRKSVKPIRSRKLERMSSNDREVGKRLDDICKRQSERELERMSDVRRALKEIEKDAEKIGFKFSVSDHSVDEFCKMFELEDDEFLEVAWIDGEPGDSYCLVSRSWDDDDRMELAGDFYFDEI